MARNINKLKTYKLKQQMGTLEEREPTDITGYLNDNYKNILVFSWKEAIQETEKRFQDRMMQSMNSEWEKSKRKLLNNIELGYSNLKGEKGFISTPNKRISMNPSTPIGKNITIDFTTPNRTQQYNNPQTPNNMYNSPNVSHIEFNNFQISEAERIIVEKYAQGVANFMKNERSTDPLGVIKYFASLSERTISNEKNQSILTICWRLLIVMFSNLGKIEEIRNAMDRDPSKIRKQMIENTKTFLEDQYSEYVKNVLLTNGISRGGNPNEHKTISLFSDFMVKKKEHVKKKDSNFAPFWPVVYYLLRIGKKEEAKRVIMESDCENVIKQCFQYYCSSATEKKNVEKNQVDNLMSSIGKIYKITKTESNFPEDMKYKLVVLNLISHCEDINVSKVVQGNDSQPSTFKQLTREIIRTTEDFIWLQLNFVEESDRVQQEKSVTFPLSKLQDSLKRFESKFKEHSPLLYFQVLLMSQQFELALLEISNREHILECTHFAIVLEYFGVLKNNVFNYPLHINNYIKLFHNSNYFNALRYYYVIRNEKLRNENLYDLISTNFDSYFGDGKNQGILTQFYNHYELNLNEIKNLELFCAKKAKKEGRVLDSIKLFFSSKQHDKVLKLLVRLVSSELLKFSLPQSENAVKICTEFLDRLPRTPSSIYSSSLQFLLRIYPFYLFYYKADYQSAFSESEKTNLLSFEISSEHINKQKANTLKNISPNVSNNIADFFNKVASCLKQLTMISRSSINSKTENHFNQKLQGLKHFATYFKDDIPNLDLLHY